MKFTLPDCPNDIHRLHRLRRCKLLSVNFQASQTGRASDPCEALNPVLRSEMSMCDRDNDNCLTIDPVDDCVRKASHEASSDIGLDFQTSKRETAD